MRRRSQYGSLLGPIGGGINDLSNSSGCTGPTGCTGPQRKWDWNKTENGIWEHPTSKSIQDQTPEQTEQTNKLKKLVISEIVDQQNTQKLKTKTANVTSVKPIPIQQDLDTYDAQFEEDLGQSKQVKSKLAEQDEDLKRGIVTKNGKFEIQRVIDEKKTLDDNIKRITRKRTRDIKRADDESVENGKKTIISAENTFHDEREAAYRQYFKTVQDINDELAQIATREERKIANCEKLNADNKKTLADLKLSHATELSLLKTQYEHDIQLQQPTQFVITFDADRLKNMFNDLLIMKALN